MERLFCKKYFRGHRGKSQLTYDQQYDKPQSSMCLVRKGFFTPPVSDILFKSPGITWQAGQT